MIRYASYESFLDSFEERGWTDGLPVVAPAAEKIDRFLANVGLVGFQRLVEDIDITAEQVAIAAVLAGCEAEQLPVVVAAVRAHYDRMRVEVSSAPGLVEAALCVIVNGPVRHALDIQCGPQCFGPGWPANAAIGRALNLVAREVEGRARHAAPAFSTPDAYSFCFGEDEEHSPWEALHVERGFAARQSAVTVHAVLASLPSTDDKSRRPEGVLDTLIDTLQSRPALAGRWPDRQAELALVVGQEQQRIFADAGWTRTQMREYLWPRLTRPRGRRPALRLGEPQDAPIVAAGGRGMAWIWVLLSHTLVPVTREIASGTDEMDEKIETNSERRC